MEKLCSRIQSFPDGVSQDISMHITIDMTLLANTLRREEVRLLDGVVVSTSAEQQSSELGSYVCRSPVRTSQLVYI